MALFRKGRTEVRVVGFAWLGCRPDSKEGAFGVLHHITVVDVYVHACMPPPFLHPIQNPKQQQAPSADVYVFDITKHPSDPGANAEFRPEHICKYVRA